VGISFLSGCTPDRHGLGLFLRQLHPGRCQVGLATYDWLDCEFLIVGLRCLSCLIEINSAENVSMIGHRHRGHLAALSFLDQILNSHRPVESRVFGVQMKVDKRVGGHCAEQSKRDLFHILEKAFSTARRTNKILDHFLRNLSPAGQHETVNPANATNCSFPSTRRSLIARLAASTPPSR